MEKRHAADLEALAKRQHAETVKKEQAQGTEIQEAPMTPKETKPQLLGLTDEAQRGVDLQPKTASPEDQNASPDDQNQCHGARRVEEETNTFGS